MTGEYDEEVKKAMGITNKWREPTIQESLVEIARELKKMNETLGSINEMLGNIYNKGIYTFNQV